MFRKKIPILLAILGISSALWLVNRKNTTQATGAPPLHVPPQKPFSQVIAASGLVEPFNEALHIAPSSSGIVEKLFVSVGDRVAQGAPLFALDARKLDAELRVEEARVEVAAAHHQLVADQLARLKGVHNPRAISQSELHIKENEEKLARAQWFEACMQRDKALTLLEQLTVRSPVEAVVLQSNIHVGEYVLASDGQKAPMILGKTHQLQIRADIDEQNAVQMYPGASGIASPKNRPDVQIPLTFVRIEPYVVPKQSLTGLSKEKVDTRVLQAVYTFTPPNDLTIYVGQQMDVFIQKGNGP